MAGNAVGNGLMACGCLIMLLPLPFMLIFVAFAIHPVVGIGVLLVAGLATFAAIGGAMGAEE